MSFYDYDSEGRSLGSSCGEQEIKRLDLGPESSSDYDTTHGSSIGSPYSGTTGSPQYGPSMYSSAYSPQTTTSSLRPYCRIGLDSRAGLDSFDSFSLQPNPRVNPNVDGAVGLDSRAGLDSFDSFSLQPIPRVNPNEDDVDVEYDSSSRSSSGFLPSGSGMHYSLTPNPSLEGNFSFAGDDSSRSRSRSFSDFSSRGPPSFSDDSSRSGNPNSSMEMPRTPRTPTSLPSPITSSGRPYCRIGLDVEDADDESFPFTSTPSSSNSSNSNWIARRLRARGQDRRWNRPGAYYRGDKHRRRSDSVGSSAYLRRKKCRY